MATRLERHQRAAKEHGAIHHRFLSSADGGALAVFDEWETEAGFQKFFQSSAEIPQLMAGGRGDERAAHHLLASGRYARTSSDGGPAPLTGGCLCGGVRFEVDAPLVVASYCHCTRCQRRTGTAASAQARIAARLAAVTQGEELIRGYRPPHGFEKLFCDACGSALWSRSSGRPRDRQRAPGRLRRRPRHPPVVAPVRRLCGACGRTIPDDGLPRYDERP